MDAPVAAIGPGLCQTLSFYITVTRIPGWASRPPPSLPACAGGRTSQIALAVKSVR